MFIHVLGKKRKQRKREKNKKKKERNRIDRFFLSSRVLSICMSIGVSRLSFLDSRITDRSASAVISTSSNFDYVVPITRWKLGRSMTNYISPRRQHRKRSGFILLPRSSLPPYDPYASVASDGAGCCSPDDTIRVRETRHEGIPELPYGGRERCARARRGIDRGNLVAFVVP